MARRLFSIFAILVFSLSISLPASPYNTIDIPGHIKSPEELARWLHNEFTYEFQFPNHKQTLDETLSRRAGDCEDFALLSQAVLNRIGVKNDIIIVKFRQLSIMHAVCMFKQGAKYSLISNREIVRTHGRSINEGITEVFPDWEKLIYLASDGSWGRTIDRGYTGRMGSSMLSVASMYGNLLGPEERDMGMIRFMLERELGSLAKSGMQFSANTFVTIFKDRREKHVKFLYDKMELTAGGFRVACVAEDKDGVRTYYALFPIKASQKSLTVAIYSETDWKRINQFNNILHHPLVETHPM